jgi:choline dehydrogenase-like flavoprotein
MSAGVVVEGHTLSHDLEERCDVVVIGTGAGGATVATELAEAGLEVVMLEEGSYYKTEQFEPVASKMVRRLYRDAGASFAIGTPAVHFAEGRCVGGSTVINGGMSWRTPEKVLDRWRREEAVDRISAREMEPYFERVERRMHVARQDPESLGRDTELLAEGATALGYKVIPNLRNQLHCAGSNNCAFGCPTGAKRSTLVSYIPRALTFGARLYTEARVTRILHKRKRATGVEARVGVNGHSRRLTVHAKVVVVAGGAAQSPALMMRSGFKSPSGRLGRDLSLHPNGKVIAVFDENVEGWKGVHQGHQVREFQDEGFIMAVANIPPGVLAMTAPQYGRALGRLIDDYNRMVVAGVLVEDTAFGRVRVGPGGRPFLFYDLSDADAVRLKRGIGLLAEMLFAAGARRVILPFEGVPDLFSPDDVKRIFRDPIPKSAMELFTVHLMGTCRMGDDPTRAVTSSYGAVHDAAGLYVADASLFPSAIGVNPMETIMALATRTAEHIAENRRRLLA